MHGTNVKKKKKKIFPLWDFTQRGFVVPMFSGQPIGTIFNGKVVCLDCLTVENGTDWLSRKHRHYESTLCKIP